MYFIDCLVFCVGNEKDIENEVDIVGCCFFKYEYIILEVFDKVIFDFFGKDSICYYEIIIVDL